MNAWQAIARMIKAQGVDYVYGIGDTDLHLFASEVDGLTAVNLRFEGSAPHMAAAYSRLTGKVGVVSGSSGPGVANLVPGVLEAYSGCVPLVVLAPSANLENEGKGEFQEVDQVGIMKPITKWSARIPYVNRISWFINRAFSIAMNGQPGPVFLEMPINVGGKLTSGIEIEIGEMPDYQVAEKIPSAGVNSQIQQAVDLILQAEKPVINAGSGAVSAAAHQAFQDFIEFLGIPFVTSPGGRGIVSEEHPLALGSTGIYRTRVAKKYYSDADLIISVGGRSEGFQSHFFEDFPENAKFIQIDISSFEIGRNWVPEVGIVGDARIVLEQLLDELKTRNIDKKDYLADPRIKEVIADKKSFEEEVKEECSVDERPIPAKRVVYELSRVFGRNTILVNENGSQDTWSYCFPYYKLHDDSAVIPVAEQTNMGMGVVGAIAAKMTCPDKNVVCVTGDGAFQMYLKEVPTAVQNKLGVTWVVLNNSAFGWIKYNQLKFADFDVSTFGVQPDFMKWAEACNCHGLQVEKGAELKPALLEALEKNKEGIPVILEVITGLDLSHFDRSE